MLKIVFLLWFILSLLKPCTYLLSFDNYFISIMVNAGVSFSIPDEKGSNEYYWGKFEADERDLLTIEIHNADEEFGLMGNINFGSNSFFIGYDSYSFLFADKQL